jgi:bifunctional non-homologous end joining protein LigD
VPWKTVVAAARTVRRALEALDLESWVKTTGGAGVHIVAPVRPERDWSECLAFTRGLATSLARQMPELFTVQVARAGRERAIFVDYLRNNRTNTSVAAFSPRARAGAPVSVPLAWDELPLRLRPERFTIATVPRRLSRQRSDPWRDAARCRQRLTAALLAAVAAMARKPR